MRRGLRRAALMIGAAVPAMLSAQTMPPEVAFGAREAVTSASLSPQGTRLAFLAPTKGQGNALYTVPVDGSTPPLRVMVASGDPERLGGCGWVSEARLLCRLVFLKNSRIKSFGGISASRLIAADHDGRNLQVLTRPGATSRYGGSVIDWLPGQNGQIMVHNSTAGIERVDTVTGDRKILAKPFPSAGEFISDGNGTVRVAASFETMGDGYSTGKAIYRYLPSGAKDWLPLSTFNYISRDGFDPHAVDTGKNVIYGFQKVNGRQALFARSLDRSMTEKLVFSRPDVDVDGLLRLGRRNRVIGVTYVTDKRVAAYFDPDFVDLRTRLARAMPGVGMINFEGASDDENILLLWTGGDIDPGRYWLFDRQTKQLRPLILSRPELDGIKLASVKPITFKGADGTSIPGYLTLPPGGASRGLPALVMPHGGPGARDEWGFDWQAQYFAHQGYAVLQPNFRGSTGYGDSWFQRNGFQSWRIAIGDIIDSGRWMVAEGIADPTKLAIVGWSYGGYAALQAGAVEPELFKAIIAIAPVTDLNELREFYRGTTAQQTMRDFIGTGKHLVEGSPTRNAAKITAPVLMFHGALDMNVRYRHAQAMEDALKDAGKKFELITYPKLEHQLEDSAARANMLKRSDTFLKAAFAK
ncbi:S9 family peptidase [Sphingomonas radiodurans]|uniref:S9 family peptidase n=1 Tax=Sphingomonas radiodurans TaxID=2890321 RepID=UPI001E389097|nr:alpha/beta fold hydrolase [Sphingomonas radiodurans]WBH17491.1 alpha/beta fold hydrolase [Sphingomonas radiodurans]